MQHDRQKSLGTESIPKLLLKFSVPAIVGMMVNALYNIVDRMYIGHIKDVGQYAITGVGITMPIMTIIMAFGMLVGIGTSASISIRLGQKKRDEAENILGNAFTLLLILSVTITVLGIIFGNSILDLFGASENTVQYAKEYINIIFFGTIFNMMSFGLNHSIRAEGNPKIAMYSMLIGAIMNTVLDPIFIFTFNLGVKGAAIATVLSQVATAIWVLKYFTSKNSVLKLKVANMKLNKKLVLSIFAIGVSPFSMQLAASVVQVISNTALRTHGGDLAIGAMTAISSIAMIFLMPIFGINQGCQPIIGFNYGAKQYKRVVDTVKYAVMAATSIVVVGFLVIQFFPDAVIGLFNNDEELLSFGRVGIRIYLAMLPVIGFQIISANYFQSIGKAKISMLLSLLRQVILLIPLLLILPNIYGLTGVWLSGPIADGLSSVITAILFYKEVRLLHLSHEESFREGLNNA